MKYVTYPWHGLLDLTWHLVQQNNEWKKEYIRHFYPSTMYQKGQCLLLNMGSMKLKAFE
jgi:hypothetical protein